MVKKVILSIAAFAVFFILAAVVFMPYTKIASKLIDDVVTKNNVDIRYGYMRVGLWGTEIRDLATGDIVITIARLDYNPVGLLFRKARFTADSPLFQASGKISGDTIEADVKGSVAVLARLVGFTGSGGLNAAINYNAASGSGSVKLTGGPVTFESPVISLDASSVEANGTLNGNVLDISRIEAKGKTSLDAKGSITFNEKRIENSALNFSGAAALMGMNLNFKLGGTIQVPRFTTG